MARQRYSRPSAPCTARYPSLLTALHLPRPHTRAKGRLLAVGGQNRARRGLSAGGEWIRTTGSPAADPHLPFVRFTKFRSSIKLCRGMASRGFPPPEVASHERKFAPGIVSFVTRLFQRCRHPQDGARADHLLCSPVPRSGRFGIAPKVTADLVQVVAPGAQDFSGIAALRRGAGGNVRLSER